MKDGEERDPLQLLGGTALRVYLYLLRHRDPVTPRELQRAMRFRSVSTAYHHLERLLRLGLVEKRGEGYVARRPSGLLSLYVSIRGRLVPRKLVEAAALTGAAIGYTLANRDPLATAILWLTALLAWREYVTLARLVSRMLEASGD